MRARSLGRNTPSGSLLKRKIQVHIESLGLKAGKAARDGRKLLRRVAQETGELLRLSENGVFEVHPQGVMAVFDRSSLPRNSWMSRTPADLTDPVRRHPPRPISQLRSKTLWMG